MTSFDVIIVGSGVIGLSTAWKLSSSGHRVRLIDPFPGRGASYVAAGMLAPVTEAAWGEEELLEATIRSASSWRDFAQRLEGTSGFPVGYKSSGTLLVGADRSDRTQLEELFEFQQHLGLASKWCSPSSCQELEPMLSPSISGGLFAEQDHQVDNRRLLVALTVACQRSGVIFDRRRVDSISLTNGVVDGVVIGEELISATIVIIAAGVGSSDISGLPENVMPPVRPVKGQIIRLRTVDQSPFLRHCVRAIARGKSVYVVPRSDGRIVLGATVEELGRDTTVTAGGVYELLRDASRILPGITEVNFVEANAGLRPGSPDNAPLVGPSSIPGLIFATGHYRNGILLAPITVECIAAAIETGHMPDWASPFDPERFSKIPKDSSAASHTTSLHPVA